MSAPSFAYRPEVDTLRALAVAAVVIYHFFPGAVPGGFVGVDIFFVISGFLITSVLLDDFARHGLARPGTALADFYGRRIRRILPPVALLLLAVLAAGFLLLLPNAFRALAREAWSAAIFAINFLFANRSGYFDGSAHLRPLLHLWSLAVEEQFYIVWPVLLFGALKMRRPLAVVGLLIALSFGVNLWLSARDSTAAFFLPFGRAWELLAGAGIALLMQDGKALAWLAAAPAARRALGLAGLAVAASATFLTSSRGLYPGVAVVPAVMGTALAIGFGDGWRTMPALVARPLLQLGRLSYSLYLWHWPVLSFATIASQAPLGVGYRLMLLGVSLVLAIASYRLVELKARDAYVWRPRAATIGFLAAVAVAAGLAQMIMATNGLAGRYPQYVRDLMAFENDRVAGVFRYDPCFQNRSNRPVPNPFVVNRCSEPASTDKPRMLLVGDSHAGHLWPGLKTVFGESYQLTQLAAGACAPLMADFTSPVRQAATERCQIINRYVLDEIARLKPAVVVMGARYAIYAEPGEWWMENYFARQVGGAQAARAAGAGRVLVVGQLPSWSRFVPSIVAKRLLNGEEAREFLPRSSVDQAVFTADAALKAADWGPGVTYIPVLDKLCDASRCRHAIGPNLPWQMLFVDNSHLSATGSEVLAQDFIAPALGL